MLRGEMHDRENDSTMRLWEASATSGDQSPGQWRPNSLGVGGMVWEK